MRFRAKQPWCAAALLAAGVITCSWPAPVRGDVVLVNQPYDGVSPGAPSEVFTDTTPVNYNQFWSTKSFDDFTVPVGQIWNIHTVTIYGQEQGDPTQNTAVSLQFASTPNFSNGATVYSGSEDASGNLDYTLTGVTLGAGTYWLTGWVTRPELDTGGQWFWSETDMGAPNGSQFYVHNPGGQLLLNSVGTAFTSPTPGSVVYAPDLPSDLAFQITGSVQSVPEPGAFVQGLVVAALGTTVLIGRVRLSRKDQASA